MKWGCLQPLFKDHADIFYLAVAVVITWSVIWKAIALWHAGCSNHPGWFTILFLVPTFSVLDIIYILVFRRVVPRPEKAPPQSEVIMRGESRARRYQVIKN